MSEVVFLAANRHTVKPQELLNVLEGAMCYAVKKTIGTVGTPNRKYIRHVGTISAPQRRKFFHVFS